MGPHSATSTRSARLAAALVLLAFVAAGPAERTARSQQPQRSSPAWTLQEALEQLQLYPQDAYLQYVTLQLARREGNVEGARNEIAQLTNARQPAWRRRTGEVNLFSLFSGSLAIQESLQLDTMTGEAPNPRRGLGQQNAQRFAADALVSISDLEGPTIQSHPWTEMLAGRAPEMSALAACVPEDQYYVRFQSVAKLLEVLELSDTWGEHLHSQTSRKAYSSLVDERLMSQLALQTSGLLRPFYDLVVKEVAVTGSDLYLREGSDVTLLFRFEQPQVFRAQMEGFLVAAANSRKDAVRSKHEYRGIEYEVVATPDRRVHVFAAYPREDLHLRSNSQVGLQRVIDTLLDDGRGADRSLAESDEFAYIRTLMPYGAKEEDGFVYLSDPFIRRLVGPELKLTERRRVLCYNHLRMIGHACALYETEHGHPPENLGALAEAGCTPGRFNEEQLSCPCGGHYTLSEDRHAGVCSHHGRVETMVPCCEIAETSVSGAEAQMYQDFVTDYNQYWRTFFDPIAIRLTATPERYRMETIILPLINNSIYQGMAMALGGESALLDLPPIPQRNIFSLAFKVDKQRLLAESGLQPPEPEADELAQSPDAARALALRQSAVQLQQLGLAMHNHHDVHGGFPPAASRDADGKPLLSWRVHLLPYLDQAALYQEFHLDESWDSPHNSKLIERMPAVFSAPGRKDAKPGTSTYVAVVGNQTLFDGTGTGRKFADVTDGSSNTVLLIDATEPNAVLWTKPDDVTFDAAKIRAAILGRYGEDGLVLMSDGSTRRLGRDVSDDDLRRAIVRNDGETLGNFGEPARTQPPQRSSFLGLRQMGLGDVDGRLAYEFLVHGLGDRIGLHVYDGEPTFDFALTQFLGQAMGSFSGRNRFDDDLIPAFLLIASLNSPVYASVPLEDIEVTDRFLAELDKSLAVMARSNTDTGWFRLERDFYELPIDEQVTARTMSIALGPVKWRFFWARIGESLFIASKPEVLQDIARLHGSETPDSKSDTAQQEHESADPAHAMVRIRAANWNQMLANFQLGWAESHRLACLDNVGRMSSLSRLVAAGGGDLDSRAHTLYGVNFFCPCGGHYETTGDHQARCTLHGSATHPLQQPIGVTSGAVENLLKEFRGMTLTLTFLEDGLHAVLDVDRR